MLSRALSLATVMLLTGCFAAIPVQAQNLEAGKSPSQIFAGTCTACHKGPRGLLKTVAPGALPGFLRQHYTTSPEMASLLSAYLVSNGASDVRYGGGLTKQGQDSRTAPKPDAAPEQLDRHGRKLRPSAPAQEAAKPDADGLSGPGQSEISGRHGRNAKRLARPGPENPEAAKPAEAAGEAEATGRPGAKQRLGKRGRRNHEEPPKNQSVKDEPQKDGPAKVESDKGEAAKPDTSKADTSKTDSTKTDAAKDDSAKPDSSPPDASKSSDDGKGDAAKADTSKPEPDASKTEGSKPEGSKDATPLRADPVPPVTPAPKAAEGDGKSIHASPTPTNSAGGSSSETAPTPSATPTSKPDTPAAAAPSRPATSAMDAPAVPSTPAGSPVPPISK